MDSGITAVRSGVNSSLRYEELSGGTLLYLGQAPANSTEGDAVWQIQKITISGGAIKIEWADGNLNYDNIWTNRASLNYS